jgi:pyruvate ferredoxin oxidoreductase gamma subunit
MAENMQIEVRFHGFGGEGVVRASEILGQAAVKCGKWAQSFPYFGTEIRGAAVKAFTRVGDAPINARCFIYEPDVLVVTNQSLLEDKEVLKGLKDESKLILNAPEPVALDVPGKVYTINATKIGYEIFKKPIVNTIMLGALIKLTDMVPLEALKEVINEEFSKNLAELNIEAITIGYETIDNKEGQ